MSTITTNATTNATTNTPSKSTITVQSATPRSIVAYLNPLAMVASLWRNRALAVALAKRDIEQKYKAHRLGILWVLVNPLVLLAVYTFVFSVVFPTKLTDQKEEKLGLFALAVFAGLLTFGIFREVAARAPMVIVSNRHFVTKMVFPLEILALAEVLSALFNFAIGMVVWLVGYGFIVREVPTWHALLVPVLILPVCLAGLGVSWIFSSLGAFLRDLTSMVELAITVLFFITPIFFRLDRLPAEYQHALSYNPLAHVIQGVRSALLDHAEPDWAWFGWALAGSLALAVVGYAFFMKSKRAFADVL